jgi:hypothetical protein
VLAACAAVACIAIALFAVHGRGEHTAAASAAARASLQVESEPAGAAISLGGEPTGLKTPATLTALTSRHVTIRVELPGYRPVTEGIAMPRTGTVTKRFVLAPAP